jgi:hypothetical protein
VRRAAAAALTAAAALLSGCGLGSTPGSKAVTVMVTRDFGVRPIAQLTQGRANGSALSMLRQRFTVATGPAGRAVQSIDGVSGSWMLFVNGVQSAARSGLNGGDRVWWDLHDQTATTEVRAVVGSYPEPFLHGVGGKRLPTTVECGSDVGAACKLVQAALDKAGIPFADQYIGTGSGSDTLGVVVGTWKDIEAEVAAELVANGPGASGVYAKFGSGGSTLQLLDAAGHAVRTLSAGAGLVAATADSQSEPTWLITGTDPAGVAAAARALSKQALDDHFAVAVDGATEIPLPVSAG